MTNEKTTCPSERRRHPRIPLSYQLQIEFDGKSYWVIGIDLGYGGAFIETDAPLVGGARFSLSLNSLEGGADTIARVAWRNGNGFGVQFVDPSEEFLDQVRLLVEPAAAA